MRGLLPTRPIIPLLFLLLVIAVPARADLTTGLVSYWSFDDSTNPGGDYSGTGNDGTVYGATWTSSGKVGGALSFDGVDDWVEIAQTFTFHQATDATLVFWMNKSDTMHRSIFWTRGDSSDYNRFNIYANYGTYGFGLDYRSANASLHDIGRVGGFGSNEWVHIAVTRSGNTYMLYEDGAYVVNRVDGSPSLPTYTGSWGIGRRSGYMYKGSLDEICLYDRALSAAEIGQLASGNQPYVIPLPGAVLLGAIGLSFAGWRLKRKTV